MPHYRIYLLDAEDHITAVREAECADDDTALAHAAKAINGHAGAEVWDKARRIGCVPALQPGLISSRSWVPVVQRLAASRGAWRGAAAAARLLWLPPSRPHCGGSSSVAAGLTDEFCRLFQPFDLPQGCPPCGNGFAHVNLC
jgi:hypothetical protein